MWPTRADGISSRMASSMPSPARRTGTTTTSADTRRPSAAPSGVCTVTGDAGRSRVASAASSRLIRTAIRRKSSGAVAASRSVTRASWTSGCSTTWTDTAPLYQWQMTNAEWQMANPARRYRILKPMLGKWWWFGVLAASLAASQAPARRTVSLVVANGIVITVDGSRRVISRGSVAIDGRDIVAVDTADAIAAGFRGRDTIDAAGAVIMPGLVNTHTHAPMVPFRALADDLALMDWLQKYIFPAEAKTVSPEFVRAGTRLAALEMIESGTTTFTDMYYFEEEVARATREAGLRGVLGQTIIGSPVADARTPAEGLARTERFIKEFAGDSLIVPAVAPHALYTNDEATLKAAAALARRYQAPLIIHLAETEDEVRIAREQHQTTPVGYLESIGFWGPRTLGAHGI